MELSAQTVSWWRPRTVADCMAGPENNFSALRLFAASLVIYGHCWAIARDNGDDEWLSRVLLVFCGTVAVNMFFFVSGFLVTMSCARRGSLPVFAKARLLRIYPALVLCVILTTFVLGPLVTTLPLRQYLSEPRSYWSFVSNASLIGADHSPGLPGVFETNRVPGVVIGSLWTLPGEMQMYAYVALMGALGLLRRRSSFGITIAILVLLATFARDRLSLVSRPEYYSFAAFFVAGASCWMFRAHVPVNGLVLVTLITLCWLTYAGPAYTTALGAATAYSCLWFVYVPGVRALNRKADYSYGLYLYGFPTQQLMAWKFPAMGPWPLLAVSFPLALALAALSWHCVEKPALALK